MPHAPSPRPAPVGPPSRHQLALMIWLAVFPTLTVLNLALGDWLADLSPVLKGGKDIGPPEQFHVGVRAVRSDLFEQILETNHRNRCLRLHQNRVY